MCGAVAQFFLCKRADTHRLVCWRANEERAICIAYFICERTNSFSRESCYTIVQTHNTFCDAFCIGQQMPSLLCEFFLVQVKRRTVLPVIPIRMQATNLHRFVLPSHRGLLCVNLPSELKNSINLQMNLDNFVCEKVQASSKSYPCVSAVTPRSVRSQALQNISQN